MKNYIRSLKIIKIIGLTERIIIFYFELYLYRQLDV